MGRPRVLITRAAHQASALGIALRELGAEPVFLPTIKIVEPSSFDPLDEAIARLQDVDWVVFTSANAVDVFAARGGAARAGLRVAAIGPATAGALQASGFRVDLVPETAVAESLAEALRPLVVGRNVLIVRAEVGREVLPDALREAGGAVTVAAAYRTVIPNGTVEAAARMFGLREEWPEAIAFSSSSTATNLLAVLEAATLKLPEDILRVSIGAITSETLKDAGYPPHVEAAEASVQALAKAAMSAIAGKRCEGPPE